MRWYLARRVLQMIPVVLGATLLIYGMVFFRPGDPIAAMFGDKPVNPAVVGHPGAVRATTSLFFVQGSTSGAGSSRLRHHADGS